jgi:pimeloyl-ACP methyl ester carboxylesterase
MQPGLSVRAQRVLMAALSVVALANAGSVNAQDTGGAPAFPPPGKLVDIGGWRLHLYCTGEAKPSQPTVILESGIGDFSVEWSLVQPSIAKFARVCSYDRADEGWSDYGPHPRTLRQIVYELHTLLEKADVRPPYVVAAHSFGGWVARVYASTYPADVVGLVLIEGGAENPVRMLGDGRLVHASDLATGRPVPPVKTAGPVREQDIPPAIISQLKAAAAENGPRANEAPRDKLPVEAQRVRTWVYSQVKHWAQGDNPFEAEELAALRAERTKTEFPYGDMPLVVLTRGISENDGPDSKANETEHRADHAAVAKLSRNGKMIVAVRSGHHVQLDEPELVVNTIREVLGAPRR